MEDLCLYQHLGCTEREVYRGGRWGNRECVHVCAIGKVGVANRGWSII